MTRLAQIKAKLTRNSSGVTYENDGTQFPDPDESVKKLVFSPESKIIGATSGGKILSNQKIQIS